MEFLGIGPLELIFIVLIALVLLGPADMLKATRGLGKFLRTLFSSPMWGEFQRSFQSLRNLPYSVAREAGLEDEMRDISNAVKIDVPSIRLSPTDVPVTLKTIEEVNRIAPPYETPPVLLDTPDEPLTAGSLTGETPAEPAEETAAEAPTDAPANPFVETEPENPSQDPPSLNPPDSEQQA